MDRDGTIDLEEELSLRESSLGYAVQNMRQIEVFDLPKTEEHHLVSYTQEVGLSSMLVTPLIHGQQIIGVLNVYTLAPHRFSNDERNVFQTLARIQLHPECSSVSKGSRTESTCVKAKR